MSEDNSHSFWSASSAARNIRCAGAVALTAGLEDKESVHAATGTAVHWISEQSLRRGVTPGTFKGQVVKTKSHSITIDDDEINSADTYVEYVVGCGVQATVEHGFVLVEQRFSFADLNPPFDAGGTGDAVIYFKEQKRLEVVDLKNGQSIVDVNDNPQLRSYALGAMLANPGLDVETITVTIVQPRAAHQEGRIRSETFHVATLIEWTSALLAAMNRSKQAIDELGTVGGNSVLFDEWAAKWLNPGRCVFCKVEGSCPALKKQALAAASVWIDDMDQPRIGNAALDTSPEAVNRDLLMIPMLEAWIKARRALAHDMAEKGTEFADFMLVETLGHRKWAADETKVAGDLVKVAGLTEDQIYDRKLKSPAGIDKVLGKKKNLTENMWMKPITGKTLAEKSKTTSPAAKSKAEAFLEE